MKRTISFILLAVLLVSMVPSALAATYIIEHESELDSLRAASASRFVIIDPIMTIDSAYDSRDSYVYDDRRQYYFSDVYDNDRYDDCVDDARDDYDDGDIDRDEYRDELRDCERRYRYTDDYRQSGPMRSLKWFYEWKFNPRTFLNRYCPPHLHRSPGTDGPTWYDVQWTHDCQPQRAHQNYASNYLYETVSRPAYSSSYEFTHYESSPYVPREPTTVTRRGYSRADDSVRYYFTDRKEQSATVTSRPVYGPDVNWHAQTEPTLRPKYGPKAHSQLQDYCDSNRAADGGMDSWCLDRAHLWS